MFADCLEDQAEKPVAAACTSFQWDIWCGRACAIPCSFLGAVVLRSGSEQLVRGGALWALTSEIRVLWMLEMKVCRPFYLGVIAALSGGAQLQKVHRPWCVVKSTLVACSVVYQVSALEGLWWRGLQNQDVLVRCGAATGVSVTEEGRDSAQDDSWGSIWVEAPTYRWRGICANSRSHPFQQPFKWNK